MFFRNFTRFVPRLILRPNINQVLSQKSLHVSAISFTKKFQHSETAFLYKFVPNYENLSNTECKQTFKVQENYDRKSIDELIKDFEALSHFCAETETLMSEDQFDSFFNALVPKIKSCTDDQLIQILESLVRFPLTKGINAKNFQQLWSELDFVCCERSAKLWKLPIILRVCNLWYKINLSKVANFTKEGITKICRRVDRLSPSEFVETMFYLTICREKVKMIDVEKRFHQVFHELTIDEVGIICLAFFKTESKIQVPELVKKIYEKTINEMDSIQDITLTNILKELRYSSSPSHISYIEEMSDVLLPKVKSCSLLACLHILLLGTNLQYCHHTLIEELMKRYNENIKLLRLKDIERVCFVLTLFNFKTDCGVEKEFLGKVVDELKARADEITLHPRCFSSTAHFLTVCGIYDEEIIRSALKEDYIYFTYGKNLIKIGREILCLDSYTRINLATTYKGPQLSQKLRDNITKFQTHYVPYRGQKQKITHSDLFLLDMKEFMERIYGENTLVHVLPHYQRPDVVYCFDENGKSVTDKILDCFPAQYKGEILFKETIFSKHPEMSKKMDNYQMVAVIMGGWNLFLRDTEIPTGELRMKLEQLEMIGYKPILICWRQWLSMNIETKEKYLEEMIRKALNKV